MKQAKFRSEVRQETDEELRAKVRDFRQELFNLRRQQQAGQIERPSRLRELRHDIARVETVLRERSIGLEQQRKGAKAATAAAK